HRRERRSQQRCPFSHRRHGPGRRRRTCGQFQRCSHHDRFRPRWRHDHHCTNNQIGPVRGGRSGAGGGGGHATANAGDAHGGERGDGNFGGGDGASVIIKEGTFTLDGSGGLIT